MCNVGIGRPSRGLVSITVHGSRASAASLPVEGASRRMPRPPQPAFPAGGAGRLRDTTLPDPARHVQAVLAHASPGVGGRVQSENGQGR